MHSKRRAAAIALLALGACNQKDCDPSDPTTPGGILVVKPPELRCAAGQASSGADLDLEFSIEGGLRSERYDIRIFFGDEPDAAVPTTLIDAVEPYEARSEAHAYRAAGEYRVRMDARTQAGNILDCRTTYETRVPGGPAVALECLRHPSTGPAPLDVSFDLRWDGCPGGCRAYWAFGDGSPDHSGAEVAHRYSAPGRYTAYGRLVAPSGATYECHKTVVVESRPTAPPEDPPYVPPYDPPSPSR